MSIDPSIKYLIQLFTSGPVRNAYRAAWHAATFLHITYGI